METFKDFMTRHREYIGQLPAKVRQAVTALTVADPNSDAIGKENEISAAVVEILGDDAFLSHLSDELPQPASTLSEEEFVSVATQVARRLLEERFGVRRD